MIYLFCLCDQTPALEDSYFQNNGINFMEAENFYAIIRNVQEGEFGEEALTLNLKDMEWLSRQVKMHDYVIQTIFQSEGQTVLPFKFGTLFYNLENLQKHLSLEQKSYSEKIKLIAHKMEWGVKLYIDKELLLKSIASNDSEIISMDQEINNSPVGKAYLLGKKKSSLLQQKESAYIENLVVLYAQELQNHYFSIKQLPLQPKEITMKDQDMLLNLAVLSIGDRLDFLMDFHENKSSEWNQLGIYAEINGPWPAYHFI